MGADPCLTVEECGSGVGACSCSLSPRTGTTGKDLLRKGVRCGTVTTDGFLEACWGLITPSSQDGGKGGLGFAQRSPVSFHSDGMWGDHGQCPSIATGSGGTVLSAILVRKPPPCPIRAQPLTASPPPAHRGSAVFRASASPELLSQADLCPGSQGRRVRQDSMSGEPLPGRHWVRARCSCLRSVRSEGC